MEYYISSIQRNKIRYFPISIISFVLLIALLPIEPPFRWYLGLGSFVILLLFGSINRIASNYRLSYFFFLWRIFGILIILSAMLNQESIKQILSGIWFIFFVPLIYFSVIPNYTKFNTLIIPIALFISTIIVVLYSVLSCPIAPRYTGVYSNPNTMGLVLSSLTASTLFLLTGSIHKVSITSIFLSIIILSSFALTLLTLSRTSTIASSAMIITFLLFLINTQHNRMRKMLSILMLVFTILAFLFYLSYLFPGIKYDFMYTPITIKTERSIERGTLTSDRYEKKMGTNDK